MFQNVTINQGYTSSSSIGRVSSIEDTQFGFSGMDGRADHTPVLWQIGQFSDLTEDAEDIEEKKSVRTQKSRRELLIEDTRPGLSGVGGILTKNSNSMKFLPW